MVLQVSTNSSGTNAVDLIPYLAFGGLKWSRNDLNGTTSGRTLDGVMHLDRIGTKIRLDLTFRQLDASEMSIVLNALYGNTTTTGDDAADLNGYVWVTYDDPMSGRRTNIKMYSNNIPAQIWMFKGGAAHWDKFSAPLIEA